MVSMFEYSTLSSLDPLELEVSRPGWEVCKCSVLLSQEAGDLHFPHCSFAVKTAWVKKKIAWVWSVDWLSSAMFFYAPTA